MFFYHTGEEVRKGDLVLWGLRRGIVEFILIPNTKNAEDFDAPDGGIMLLVDWEGNDKNSIMETPDGEGIFDEDLEFVERAK